MKNLLVLCLAVALIGCAQRVPPDPTIDAPTEKPQASSARTTPPRPWGKELTDVNPDVRSKAADQLQQMGEDAVPVLREALKASSPAEQKAIITQLGDMGEVASNAAADLREKLKDNDPEMRLLAAQALGQIYKDSDDRTVSALTVALQDKSPAVRAKSAWALGHLSASAAAAVPDLIQSLKDENDAVKLEAIQALGHIGPEARDAVVPVAAFLESKNDDFRHHAVDALQGIGKHAVPSLVQAVKNADPVVRKRAIEGLGHIRLNRDVVVPALVEALKDADPGVRREAAQTLKQLDPDAAKQAGVP